VTKNQTTVYGDTLMIHIRLLKTTDRTQLQHNKKLSYRRRTARRTLSVEIMSTAAQQYEK